MTTQPDRDRLPGGLSLRRARRALRRARHFVTPYEDGGIDATGQPALLRLVADVAWSVDARPPDRVGLRGFGMPHVNVRDGRTELWLAAPLLLVQPADEIRALVAHELATVHPVEPELVAQLYCLRDDAAADELSRLVGGRRPIMYRPVRTVRGLVAEVEARADAAAGRIAGIRHAAVAFVKASRLAADCRNVVCDLEAELGEIGCKAGIVDVFTLWLDRLERFGPEYPASLDRFWRPGAAERHPGLATAIADLRPDELDTRPGGPRVDLAPFSADEARALAADAFTEPHEQWISTADVPDSVWQAVILAAGRETLETIAEFADRVPDGVADAMAAACELEYHDDDEKQELLISLAEYTLVPRGWRRAHPMQPGVLTDPSGTEHDLRTTALRAVTDPRELADLIRLIDPQP
jgi:hypothetical protein